MNSVLPSRTGVYPFVRDVRGLIHAKDAERTKANLNEQITCTAFIKTYEDLREIECRLLSTFGYEEGKHSTVPV